MNDNKLPFLKLSDISKRFSHVPDLAARFAHMIGNKDKTKSVQALDKVSLEIHKGEVFGLVGESGCGKSTLGRIVAGLLKPTSGEIYFSGQDVSLPNAKEIRKTALRTQMVFQDPFASLNPRKRVREIIGEAPRVHRLVAAEALDVFLDNLMTRCGLDPSYKSRFPHQFSGGQRQRIAIARALAVNAEFIVCDEVVSALDVSIQAQILNLFMELKREFDLTILFISHDLGVVEHACDRVGIMYLGRMVEIAETEALFKMPLHPYSQGLINEVPSLSKRGIQFDAIKGEIPSPLNPPSGCQFHPRCPRSTSVCHSKQPELLELRPGRFVACHHVLQTEKVSQ